MPGEMIQKVILGVSKKLLRDKGAFGHSQGRFMSRQSYLTNLTFFYYKDQSFSLKLNQ